jgi:hypothetical protein
MRGQTNRIKLNVSRTEKDLSRVVDEVNRLPFAFVGASLARSTEYIPTEVNTWQSVSFAPTIDFDGMVKDGTRALILDGCDGVYQFGFFGATASGAADFRFIVNGVSSFQVRIDNIVRSRVSTPVALSANSVVEWQYRAATTGIQLAADCRVSLHRLGLFP